MNNMSWPEAIVIIVFTLCVFSVLIAVIKRR